MLHVRYYRCLQQRPCKYEHRAFTAEEKASYEERHASRSPSPKGEKKKKDPSKIKCRFFFTAQGCNNGDQCSFSHDEKFRKKAAEGDKQ